MDGAFPFWDNRDMMDLGDLRAFARIAELKSISAAARALRAPKSSVSRCLARLEATIGAPLVERSTRRLRLTDMGTLFQPHALRVLAEVQEAEGAVSDFAGVPRGTLRVNAPITFAIGLIAPMLAPFVARFPEVRIVLDVENRRIDVLAEEVDLVIRIGTLPDSQLVARRLATLQLWACASPAYLAERGTPASVADLSSHALLAWADRPTSWGFTAPSGAHENVEVTPGTVLPEPAIMQVAVAGGAGIARLPDFLVAGPIARGELVHVLPDHAPESVEVYALYPSRRSISAKVRVFTDALVAHLLAARQT